MSAIHDHCKIANLCALGHLDIVCQHVNVAGNQTVFSCYAIRCDDLQPSVGRKWSINHDRIMKQDGCTKKPFLHRNMVGLVHPFLVNNIPALVSHGAMGEQRDMTC